MDFEGNLKEMPNMNNKDYAIQYVNPSQAYTVIKMELDALTNEKRFNCLLNEAKQSPSMISKMLPFFETYWSLKELK